MGAIQSIGLIFQTREQCEKQTWQPLHFHYAAARSPKYSRLFYVNGKIRENFGAGAAGFSLDSAFMTGEL